MSLEKDGEVSFDLPNTDTRESLEVNVGTSPESSSAEEGATHSQGAEADGHENQLEELQRLALMADRTYDQINSILAEKVSELDDQGLRRPDPSAGSDSGRASMDQEGSARRLGSGAVQAPEELRAPLNPVASSTPRRPLIEDRRSHVQWADLPDGGPELRPIRRERKSPNPQRWVPYADHSSRRTLGSPSRRDDREMEMEEEPLARPETPGPYGQDRGPLENVTSPDAMVAREGAARATTRPVWSTEKPLDLSVRRTLSAPDAPEDLRRLPGQEIEMATRPGTPGIHLRSSSSPDSPASARLRSNRIWANAEPVKSVASAPGSQYSSDCLTPEEKNWRHGKSSPGEDPQVYSVENGTYRGSRLVPCTPRGGSRSLDRGVGSPEVYRRSASATGSETSKGARSEEWNRSEDRASASYRSLVANSDGDPERTPTQRDTVRSESRKEFEKPTGYQKKAPKYDGKSSWLDYLRQFEIIAKLNSWSYSRKSMELATSLESEARQILTNLSEEECTDYQALQAALSARFEPEGQFEVHENDLRNRRRKRSESIPELLQDIKRLTKRSYPNANAATIQQISKSAFITALDNEKQELFVKSRKPLTVDAAALDALSYETHVSARSKANREFVRAQTHEYTNTGSKTDEAESKISRGSSEVEQLLLKMGDVLEKMAQTPRKPNFRPGTPRKPVDIATVRCYGCQNLGHYKRECPHSNGASSNDAAAPMTPKE